MKHKAFKIHQFKALDEAQGIFEAIVAVFNNVDRGGDKIVPGAFQDSLKHWEAKGRPIPVIFSHEWDNLDAHIGELLEARELLPGDAALPEEIRELGGLWVKGQIDLEEEFAARVFKKMKRGTLAEFSFAYDVIDSAMVTEEGKSYYELRKLDLWEVGPCLVGMNPETQLLGVKEGRRNSTKDADRIQRIHDLCVELGAKCAEPNDSGESETEGDEADSKAREGTPSGLAPSTLAARLAIELMELD